jgi:hypothetical protein
MKLKIQTDCQIRIAYHWRKYWKIKQAKIAAEAERKKNKKKKQLSKTSKLTKKKKKAAPKKTEAVVDSNNIPGKTSAMEVRNDSTFFSTINARAESEGSESDDFSPAKRAKLDKTPLENFDVQSDL